MAISCFIWIFRPYAYRNLVGILPKDWLRISFPCSWILSEKRKYQRTKAIAIGLYIKTAPNRTERRFDRNMRATLLTKAFTLFERLASLSIHVQMAFKRVLKVINKAKQWNQAKPKFPGLLCFVFLFPPVWLRHEKIMAAQGLIILTGERWGPKLYLVFNLRKIARIEFKINFYLLDRYYVSFTGKIRPKYTWNKNILNSFYSF